MNLALAESTLNIPPALDGDLLLGVDKMSNDAEEGEFEQTKNNMFDKD